MRFVSMRFVSMHVRYSLVGILLAALLAGPVPGNAQTAARNAKDAGEAASSSRHAAFGHVLTRYVDADGQVDYARLKRQADSTLNPYLRWLGTTDPSGWSQTARLAFWINAYNAYTLKLIVDHYPVQTIWAITPGPPTPPKKQSPFQLEVGPVADTVRTLDEIEHEIIRVRFDEPRIHFAVVCAAKSCPRLRREAYTGPRLHAQLNDQARTFLHDDRKNEIPARDGRIALSRILKWYGDDFGASPRAVQRSLAPCFEGPVRERLRRGEYAIEYLPYDWALNDQALAEGAAPGR
jgi:hypothetical protein